MDVRYVKYGFGCLEYVNVILSVVTNIPLCWELLIITEFMHCVEVRDIWKISVPSSQFCCEPKIAVRNFFFFKVQFKSCWNQRAAPQLRCAVRERNFLYTLKVGDKDIKILNPFFFWTFHMSCCHVKRYEEVGKCH